MGSIDKPVLQAKARLQMLARGLHPVFFNGVTTGNDKSDSRLARQMHVLVGDFPAEAGIATQYDGFVEKPAPRQCHDASAQAASAAWIRSMLAVTPPTMRRISLRPST